jgi:hypothetical protein
MAAGVFFKRLSAAVLIRRTCAADHVNVPDTGSATRSPLGRSVVGGEGLEPPTSCV